MKLYRRSKHSQAVRLNVCQSPKGGEEIVVRYFMYRDHYAGVVELRNTLAIIMQRNPTSKPFNRKFTQHAWLTYIHLPCD